jgi:hypothetical protein
MTISGKLQFYLAAGRHHFFMASSEKALCYKVLMIMTHNLNAVSVVSMAGVFAGGHAHEAGYLGCT